MMADFTKFVLWKNGCTCSCQLSSLIRPMTKLGSLAKTTRHQTRTRNRAERTEYNIASSAQFNALPLVSKAF